MFVTDTGFTVRYAETDQMGIVHHSHYPVWFEAGRTDYIRRMGMPYSQVEQQGALLPLVELKCSYKGVARYEDEIVVRTRIKEYNGVRLTFFYEVFKQGEEQPITTGETMHAWTTKDLKPVNIRKLMPELHEIICAAMSLGE